MTHLFARKLQSTLIASGLIAGSLIGGSNAVAQGNTLKVTVPFAFENGGQHLPAGTYRIELQSEHMMLLRGSSGSAGFAMTNPEQHSKTAKESTISFHRYGGKYFLREVQLAGAERSLKCVKSRQEKQLQIAENTPTPSTVEIALNQNPR